jgi:hypothetical protein
MIARTQIYLRAAVALVLSSTLGTSAFAQHWRETLPPSQTPLNSRSIPQVDAQKSAAERMDWMASQIASLERKVADDESVIASLRSEVDALLRPPHGYTRAFITKGNWDHLDDQVGIIYYPPIK